MAATAFPAILGAVTAVAKAFRDNRETFGNVFSTLGTVLTKVVIPAIGQVAKILAVIAGSAAAPVIGGLAKLLSGIGGPALAAVAGIIAFKAAVSGVKTVVEGISTAIGSVKAKGGLLGALGGPWGIILGVAAGALAVWATKAADAKQHVDDLTDSIKADSGAFGQNTRASIVNRLEKEGILKQAGKLGVSLSDLTEAILGNRDAAARVNEQLARYKDVQAQASSLGTKAIRPLNEQERAQHANATAAQALRDALHEETGAVNEANASARRQATALAGSTGAARTTRGAVSALTDVIEQRARPD